MIGVGPTTIVVLILFVVCAFLYWLADKCDKEDEAKRAWEEYYQQLNEFNSYYFTNEVL